MTETLGTTLIVIFCVLIFFSQLAGIGTLIFLFIQNRKLNTINNQLVAAFDQRQALAKKIDDSSKEAITEISNKLNTSLERRQVLVKKIEESSKEVIAGQFQLADLTTKGIAAITEYLNKSSQAMTDSLFDAINKNTEDILKLNTENSQKVYDSLFVNIQMMNSLMSALGYRPTAPVEPGLQDPKRGQNYSAPPAPAETF